MPITRVAVALLCAVLVSTVGAAAQERKATERPETQPPPGREHFQLKFGAGYDQGDFGTNDKLVVLDSGGLTLDTFSHFNPGSR